MIEFLAEYGLFLAKVATFLVALIILIGVIAQQGRHGSHDSGELKIRKINEHIEHMQDALREMTLSDVEFKQFKKQREKEQKDKHKTEKKAAKSKDGDVEDGKTKKNVYVLDFDGDMKASDVELLREEITAVLSLAKPVDEVVVKLESPGGMVHAYGLASSQLTRIKSANIPLTICVDKVAASGGYMMACIADKILAAPFAVIGSIGVVASLPNFHRVLKKHDVDYELLTAGEYKRTLTMLGENTEQGRKKFVEDLEETHDLFKDFVSQYRPSLNITEVATGETWYGKRALEKNLIDGISTSDEYLTQLAKDHPVYQLTYQQKRNWQEKLGFGMQAALVKSIDKLLPRLLDTWNNKH